MELPDVWTESAGSMNASEPYDRIRVLCLHDGDAAQAPLPELLAAEGKLQCLGSLDIRSAPFERVLALQPEVVILQLPMPALHVLRWINYLRMGWQNCIILVTGPLDVPYYHQSVLSYGADDFIAEDNLALRLLPSILAHYKQHIPAGVAASYRPYAV